MRRRPELFRTRTATAVSAMAAALLALSGCTATGESPRPGTAAPPAGPAVTDPVVATYDGGIWVLDGRTLRVVGDIPLQGFNRLNPAGDDEHVMVSTSTGFRVLNAAHPHLTDVEFPAAKPGHVVRHAGRTVLFADGSGEIISFDPNSLGNGKPRTENHTTAVPHHGVAIELANGELLITLGTEEKRVGIAVLDKNRQEITRNEDCPGVHGEATAQGEAVVVGCENGALLYKNGEIKKIPSPTEYGRIGNQSGTEESPIVLGDYKQDKDAELERPETISLIDTTNGTLRLIDLGTSYTFRSLGRGPQGEALILGTDGRLHVIDPVAGRVVNTIPVIDRWQEPLEWQQPRPTLFVRGGTAYITDPNKQEIHSVDLTTATKTATSKLPSVPNELSGIQS